jgi:nitroreductase
MTKSILEHIKTRTSIFPASYTQEAISKEDLNTILESARWAPTHKRTEPWRYKIIQGNGREALGHFMQEQFIENTGKSSSLKVKKLADKMNQASAIILIFMHRDEKESIPEWEEIAAVSMSVQNMWLTASALGLGAYWSSPKDFADVSKFNQITCDPQDKFLGFFYLGTVDVVETVERERMEVEEFVQFVG